MNQRQLKYFNEILQLAKSRNWIIVTSNYVNNKTKMIFRCDKGHIQEKTPASFKISIKCKKCIETDESIELYELAKKEGYEVLGTYINASTKINMICPKHKSLLITTYVNCSLN